MDETLRSSLRELRQIYNGRLYVGAILGVTDGDTIDALILLEPETGTWVRRGVRLVAMNAPETRGIEAWMGKLAKEHLELLIGDDQTPGAMFDLRRGKYAGRIVGRVTMSDGADLSHMMIEDGYAVPYDARKARPRFDPHEPFPLERPEGAEP